MKMSSPRKSRRPNRKRSPSSATDRPLSGPAPRAGLGSRLLSHADPSQRRSTRDVAPGNRLPRGQRPRSGRNDSPLGIAPSPLAIAPPVTRPLCHAPPTALSSHGPNPEKPPPVARAGASGVAFADRNGHSRGCRRGIRPGTRPSPLRPRPELSGRHTPGVSYSEMLMPSEDNPGPRSHPPRLPPLPRIDLPWWSDPPHRSGPACPVTPCFHLSPNAVPRQVAAPC